MTQAEKGGTVPWAAGDHGNSRIPHGDSVAGANAGWMWQPLAVQMSALPVIRRDKESCWMGDVRGGGVAFFALKLPTGAGCFFCGGCFVRVL